MPFEFSLQRILSLTHNEKVQLEQEYGRVYQLLENVGHRLIDLMKRKEQITQDLEDQMTKQGASISLIQDQQAYLQSLEGLILEQQKQYNTIRDQLEQNKAMLLDKSIEQKKYEKLKQREVSHFKKEMTMKEMKSLDEVAARKFFYQ